MKSKRGTITPDNKVMSGAHSYPIVKKEGSKWEYEEEKYVTGAEVKFSIVHKHISVTNGRVKNKLCAQIL